MNTERQLIVKKLENEMERAPSHEIFKELRRARDVIREEKITCPISHVDSIADMAADYGNHTLQEIMERILDEVNPG